MAAQMCRAGAIGEIVAFSASSLAMLPDDSPYLTESDWRSGDHGNWIVDVGVHMAAALRMVLGGDVTVRGVVAKQVRSHIRPFDTFSAALALERNGAPGSWLFSLSAPPFDAGRPASLSDLELRVVGTTGSILVSRSKIEWRGMDGVLRGSHSGFLSRSVSAELRAAAVAILEQGDSAAPGSGLLAPSEAIKDLAVIEALLAAAQQSAPQG